MMRVVGSGIAEQVPNEAWAHTFLFLDNERSFAAVACVCRVWSQIPLGRGFLELFSKDIQGYVQVHVPEQDLEVFSKVRPVIWGRLMQEVEACVYYSSVDLFRYPKGNLLSLDDNVVKSLEERYKKAKKIDLSEKNIKLYYELDQDVQRSCFIQFCANIPNFKTSLPDFPEFIENLSEIDASNQKFYNKRVPGQKNNNSYAWGDPFSLVLGWGRDRLNVEMLYNFCLSHLNTFDCSQIATLRLSGASGKSLIRVVPEIGKLVNLKELCFVGPNEYYFFPEGLKNLKCVISEI